MANKCTKPSAQHVWMIQNPLPRQLCLLWSANDLATASLVNYPFKVTDQDSLTTLIPGCIDNKLSASKSWSLQSKYRINTMNTCKHELIYLTHIFLGFS